MTEVSDSSIFSRYGFWSVNASPVSTSANLSSRSPMSDMPSHLLDRVRRPYRHLRVPRHARPHGGSSRRSPSERPRASVESEQWRQAHRANRSCSIEKRRRFTGPGLRPLRTTSRRAARDHDFRTNPAFPADGSTRGSLPPRTSSRRPRDASGSRVALASVEELQCQPVLLLIVLSVRLGSADRAARFQREGAAAVATASGPAASASGAFERPDSSHNAEHVHASPGLDDLPTLEAVDRDAGDRP